MKHFLLTTTLILATVGLATAQQKKTPASPPAEAAAAFGGKAVTIKYASPSVKGRKIFGGLVPFGEVWRAGANSATALHETDLQIGTLSVPKGDYTIYAIPTATEWTLIINKQTGQWGTEYSQANDLGRAKMTVKAAPALVESFKISLSASALTMEWENTIATVAIKAK
jgi:hypothetical protein